MKIARKVVNASTMRVPREMKAAVGDDIMMIVFGNVVLITPSKFELKPTLRAIRTVMRMMETSVELEDEEMQAEMKEVLKG